MTALKNLSLKKAFDENGFCIVKNFIDLATLDALCAEIGQIFHSVLRENKFDSAPPETYPELCARIAELKQKDEKNYLAAAKACNHLFSLAKLSTSDQLENLLVQLGIKLPTIATRTVLHFMSDALKISGGYLKTPAHQDFRSVQGSLNSAVLWIPLADVGADDFPVQIVPQSHRFGLLGSGEHVFCHQIDDKKLPELQFEDVLLNKGDALIFSSLLVHRTKEEGGDDMRIAASFRYNDAKEKTYLARGLPIPYIYKADMELRSGDFPTKEDMYEYLKVDKPQLL